MKLLTFIFVTVFVHGSPLPFLPTAYDTGDMR